MPYALPKEYRSSHALAFALHDVLVDILKMGEAQMAFHVSRRLENEEDARAMESLSGDELRTWCQNNGYADLLAEVIFRQIAAAVLADFCHFVYEGLQCSAKGKLTVALALFRKPLRDNLLYLEWMLADREDLLGAFRLGREDRDVAKIPKERKVEIIGRAMDRAELGRWLSPEEMYDLRYEKAAAHGFDPVCNRALHIVTTFKHYATEPGDLNLLFCDAEDRLVQWEHIYFLLPVIMFHAVSVVDALIGGFAPQLRLDGLAHLRLVLSFLLWSHEKGFDEGLQTAKDTLHGLLATKAVECRACGSSIRLGKSAIRLIADRGEIRCRKCQHIIDLYRLPSGSTQRRRRRSQPRGSSLGRCR